MISGKVKLMRYSFNRLFDNKLHDLELNGIAYQVGVK